MVYNYKSKLCFSTFYYYSNDQLDFCNVFNPFSFCISFNSFLPWFRICSNSYNILNFSLLLTPTRLLFSSWFFKKHCLTRIDQCIDILGVDNLNLPFSFSRRFSIIYIFNSYLYSSNLIFYCQLKHSYLQIMISLIEIFNSSNWLEREIWDLFGIYFQGHSDLRRILTDYGFKSHPLRKDFPLSGFDEVFFNISSRRIIYTPVVLGQVYRNFSFSSLLNYGDLDFSFSFNTFPHKTNYFDYIFFYKSYYPFNINKKCINIKSINSFFSIRTKSSNSSINVVISPLFHKSFFSF